MRLPVLTEHEMTPPQKELAERITARRGAVRGPFRVWLHSPQMCERAESLGAFARFDCNLPEHLRELTLLLAARNWDAQYSWNAHVRTAMEAGVPEEAVRAIAEQQPAGLRERAGPGVLRVLPGDPPGPLRVRRDLRPGPRALRFAGTGRHHRGARQLHHARHVSQRLPGRPPGRPRAPFPDIRGFERVARDGDGHRP